MNRQAVVKMLLVCALGFLGACQSQNEELLGLGYPEPYVDGHGDGCQSGRSVAGQYMPYEKNEKRYDTQPQYQKGWDDGYNKCLKESKGSVLRHLQFRSE